MQNKFFPSTEPTVSSTVTPTDISPLNSLTRIHSILSFKDFVFPKCKDNRSFQRGWLEKYSWLEYSISRDAAFCFACRQFALKNGNIDTTFTNTGFSNWKKALEKCRGFHLHESSITHRNAMLSWKDRDDTNSTVAEQLTESVLEKRRFYMTKVVQCLIFLIQNEVSLRGSWDLEKHSEDGIFRNLFQFEMNHSEELRKCHSLMPKNATYLSPEIQNEIISILAAMVQEEIVNEMKTADVRHFTIYVDGTKTRTHKECMSVATRYVLKGHPIESLLQFYGTDKFDAKTNAALILKTVEDCNLSSSHILSQCYDGANVMSGDEGGIQRIIQETLGRVVPYVHCFNHRLHLCVIAALEKVEIVKQFFDNIKLLYDFLRRPKMQPLYEGTALISLIATRWSGHNRSTIAVHDNYNEIVAALSKVRDH